MARHLCQLLLAIAVGLHSTGLAYAQIYYQDDFSQNTIAKYESAGIAKWSVVQGQLQTRKSDDTFNILALKRKYWKKWTSYTYEVTVMPQQRTPSAIYACFDMRET